MSRNYDNWEKLVAAVLKREEFRRLAHCESFSTSISTDFSARPSFDSDDPHDSRNSKESSGQVSFENFFESRNIKAIPFEEIKLATQNFQPDMLLGEGRFGSVFKGWIHEHFLTAVKPGSGVAVAIKKLNQSKIFCLNQPHHPNLVKLIGYSFEKSQRVLVYEFVPNGSLDNHLFTRGHQLLSWETRVKVATGAARSLSFLHDLAIVVTHVGIKSSSILLDDEFNAKLSDLDLATVPRLTSFSTLVRNDYASPEYIASGTGRLTMKSDVYSFGIVLLELLTGLRVFDKNRPMKEQNLIVWVKRYFSNKKNLLEIVDSRLEGQYPHDGAYKCGKLALQCLSVDPKLRPRMGKVVDLLEKFLSPISVGPHYFENSTELSTGIIKQMDHAGSSNWDVVFRPFNDMISGMAIEYEGLIKATNNFHSDMLLGEGAFGCVYKGLIDEYYLTATKHGRQITVAVKKMNPGGVQGKKEFLDNIRYFSQLRHPNLILLIGYSFNEDSKILVYEFIGKGSLENQLFTRGHYSLNWATRVKVAKGAARAIAFMHDWIKPVIHGNIMSSKILIDSDFTAKLSAFGFARDGPIGGRTHVSTRITGTYGYTAPEYIATGQFTTRSDVYSFGAVLLELLSGRRIFDSKRPAGEQNLVDWAKPYLHDKIRLFRIVDSRLEGTYTSKQAYEVAKITLQCLSVEPKLRPKMSEVVGVLEKL